MGGYVCYFNNWLDIVITLISGQIDENASMNLPLDSACRHQQAKKPITQCLSRHHDEDNNEQLQPTQLIIYPTKHISLDFKINAPHQNPI